MNVVLLNGSPHAGGSTFTALSEVARGLEEHGVSTEIIHVCEKPLPGCRGCYGCRRLGRCVMDDAVNRIAERIKQADGMILGSPVYFASPNADFLAILDRLYAAHGRHLRYKPCGTTAALDALNKYPLVCEQPVVASSYWCMVHGNDPQQVKEDPEGMEIAYHLGRNMAWMVKALHGIKPPAD